MKTHSTFASRRALLRGCDFPPVAANPFAAGRRPAFYADGGDPPPPPPPPPPALTAETAIPEALRTELGIGDTATVGALAKRFADTQAALRNPTARTEDYSLDGINLGDGVEERHIRELMPAAKAAGVSQEAFVRFANANVEAYKKESAEWRQGAEKELGGADGLTKLWNQIRVFGDKEFKVDGIPTETLKGMKAMVDKMSAAGVMPPGGEGDPPPPSDSALVMEHNGKKHYCDPADKASVQAFYNLQIEVDDGKGGKKMVYANEHISTRLKHAEIYNRALRDAARLPTG